MGVVLPIEADEEEKSKKENPLEDRISYFKNLIQDCNLSFLFGSGVSVPFMKTLGGIENWLTALDEDKKISETLRAYIKASLYKAYFEVAMRGNIEIEKYSPELDWCTSPELIKTYSTYQTFFQTINQILYERRSNTVNKQVNIFTSNIDIFCEKAIEDLGIHFNDGFNGIFRKQFQLSNFRRSFFQKSLHYDNMAEIPVFNLVKIHGSVTWRLNTEIIEFAGLSLLQDIVTKIDDFNALDILSLSEALDKESKSTLTMEEIVVEAKKVSPTPSPKDFIQVYEQLQVVNPTKDKFRDTTFNKTYYEMLRMYANELEKENSVLFIMGFSMADEHIRDITFRAIRSNPTLKVFICSYSPEAKDILANLKQDRIDLLNFHNVELLSPAESFGLSSLTDLLFIPVLESIQNQKVYK